MDQLEQVASNLAIENTELLTIRQEIMQVMCTIITLPLILLFHTSQSDDL